MSIAAAGWTPCNVTAPQRRKGPPGSNMDQSFRQQHKQSTAAAAQKISRFPSPVLMDDVSGSGKKRHKYHEGTGRSAVPRLLWWGAEKKGRYSGRESVTRNFPVCVTAHCLPGKGKAACPPKRADRFCIYLRRRKRDNGLSSGFSGVCVVSLPSQRYLSGNSSRAFSAKRRPKISKSALHSS